MADRRQEHRIVIVGGGFGGLYAAKSLAGSSACVTLIDKRNFHLFQPLLYQVATGGISPGDISSPLRAVLRRGRNIRVWQAEVTGIDAERREVVLVDGRIPYDTLVAATGVSHHYFGNDHWATNAPGLKTVEDALDIRRRILTAFEAAERETDPAVRRAWLTFVIVGGGPTGVELAGALAELGHFTLKHDFRAIDTREMRILLVEGTGRVLPSYPAGLSRRAEMSLVKLGVTVEKETLVTNIRDGEAELTTDGRERRVEARTVLWAAGVRASELGQILAEQTAVPLDGVGRVIVETDLTVPGYPEIFVIGDLAHFRDERGEPLPGTAPVAIQQGRYVARVIKKRVAGEPVTPFRFKNRGNLTVIGRNAAVADFRRVRLSGYLAWLAWVFVHIWYLIEFDNKIIVMVQWGFDYFTRKRGARLITGGGPSPSVSGASPTSPRD